QLQFRLRVMRYVRQMMKDAWRSLASQTKRGLWYKRSLDLPGDWQDLLRAHSFAILQQTPQQDRVAGRVVFQRFVDLRQGKGWVLLFEELFGFFVLILLATFARRGLGAVQNTLLARQEDHDLSGVVVFSLWIVALVYYSLPWWVGFVCLLGVLWFFDFPGVLHNGLLFTVFLWPCAQMWWVSARMLFAAQSEKRLLSMLDDRTARGLRLNLRLFSVVSLIILPVLFVILKSDMPEVFVHFGFSIYFGFVLFCALWFLSYKRIFLELLPQEPIIFQRISVVLSRVYFLIPFTFVVAFGCYAWGYVNFSALLVRGVAWSLCWVCGGYLAKHLIWWISRRLLGVGKGREIDV
ncbi:MAG: hypothetical protein AAGJ35_15565, partial [Myxococcota bacterium]